MSCAAARLNKTDKIALYNRRSDLLWALTRGRRALGRKQGERCPFRRRLTRTPHPTPLTIRIRTRNPAPASRERRKKRNNAKTNLEKSRTEKSEETLGAITHWWPKGAGAIRRRKLMLRGETRPLRKEAVKREGRALTSEMRSAQVFAFFRFFLNQKSLGGTRLIYDCSLQNASPVFREIRDHKS